MSTRARVPLLEAHAGRTRSLVPSVRHPPRTRLNNVSFGSGSLLLRRIVSWSTTRGRADRHEQAFGEKLPSLRQCDDYRGQLSSA